MTLLGKISHATEDYYSSKTVLIFVLKVEKKEEYKKISIQISEKRNKCIFNSLREQKTFSEKIPVFRIF